MTAPAIDGSARIGRYSPQRNAGSIPARWPRFGKEKLGSNPGTAQAVADGSVGLTAGKDRQ